MSQNTRKRFPELGGGSRRWIAPLLGGIAVLAIAASAMAAHPKKGASFTGIVVGPEINGFKPPVKFKVSADGKTLTGFTYSTLGCFSAGGFRPGVDYYTKPGALIKIGVVKVSPAGRFSVSHVVSVYKGPGGSTTTTSTITGGFTSPTAVSGTVTFTQKLSPGGAKCSSTPLPVEAKA